GVGEVHVIAGDLDEVILVGSQGEDDVLDMFGVVGAGGGMDVGTAPVVFLRGIGDAPDAVLTVPVGVQGKVDAPGGQQEGKDLGGRAHGLVPVVVPLALDGFVEVSGVQPFLGGVDPVHDLLVHLDGGLTGRHP